MKSPLHAPRLAISAVALLAAACADPSSPAGPAVSDAPLASRGGAADVAVIVTLRGDFSARAREENRSSAERVARELGVTPTHTYGAALFGFAATIPEGRLNGLRNDPRVASIDFDAPVSIPERDLARPGSGGGTPSPQVTPWGITRIGAAGLGNNGSGVHVYVIDTGIDRDHPDLAYRVSSEGFASVSCRGGGCSAAWDDDNDHGTHVAGTIAANDNDRDVVGVAPEATLHAVKVLSSSGSGSRSSVIAGIDWVTDQANTKGYGAVVANMSLGGSGSKTSSCTASGFSGTDTYHQALCNAAKAGVIMVVAAGNSSADAKGFVPAAYDDAVITVSASRCTSLSGQTCNGTDDWASFSNWGTQKADWTSILSAPVAVGAPGVSVLSLKRGGGTVSFNGTSMASPHVAGIATLWRHKNSSTTRDYSAFTNARSAILANTSFSGTNTSGYTHNELIALASAGQ